MLQHEQTDPPVSPTIPLPISNAAEARVTPDELNAALKALEDRQNSTVAIGSVVDELRLNVTPEEIWAQVENQRTQKSAEERAKQNLPGAAGPSRSFVYQILSHLRSDLFPPVSTKPTQTHRRVRLGWRRMRGWVWALFWCTGGLGLFSGFNLLGIGQTIVVNGDNSVQTIQAEGKRVIINGDGDLVHIQGKASGVTVNGDNDKIALDIEQDVQTNGDNDTVYPPSPIQSARLQVLEEQHTK